jgi:hypothetical protein
LAQTYFKNQFLTAKLAQPVQFAMLQVLYTQVIIFAQWAITVKEEHYSLSSVLLESIVQFLEVNLLILVLIAMVDIIVLILVLLYLLHAEMVLIVQKEDQMKHGVPLVTIVLLRHKFKLYAQEASSVQERVNSCLNVRMVHIVPKDQPHQSNVQRVVLDQAMLIMAILDLLASLVEEVCIRTHLQETEYVLIVHQVMFASVILQLQLLSIKLKTMVISAQLAFTAQRIHMRSDLALLEPLISIKARLM